MSAIYFDCFAGASGDMLLGALLDLGLPLETLEKALAGIKLEEYSLSLRRVVKQGVSAAKFGVHTKDGGGRAHDHDHPHALGRSLSQIERLLREGTLPERPRERALRAFRRLGEVEAGIHDVPIEEIHFHEMGAVDSIVDITGFFLALDALGIERVFSSPLPVGRGFVMCAHGRMPVPAPATAKLLEGIPVFDNGLEGEILTPTGALLLAESAEGFGPMPPMTVRRVGYGAGDRDQPVPNAVRALLGETAPAPRTDAPPGSVAVLEANLDDMRPELFPHVFEGALARGALDAFAAPVVGKKGRPAHLLTLLCPEERRAELTRFLFRETTTLGVRHRLAARATAERDWLEVDLPWGRVRVKRATFEGEVVNLAPEYEDCRRLAESSGVPLKEVIEAASAAARAALAREDAAP
ncbi:MAG: nickel pincer cofactor biosynthesis protein LarC [bacterium]